MNKKGQNHVVERFFTQLRKEKRTLVKKMIKLTLKILSQSVNEDDKRINEIDSLLHL